MNEKQKIIGATIHDFNMCGLRLRTLIDEGSQHRNFGFAR
jgi:hypothetical protein